MMPYCVTEQRGAIVVDLPAMHRWPLMTVVGSIVVRFDGQRLGLMHVSWSAALRNAMRERAS